MSGQEVILQLGDRRNSGFCLRCGTILMVPWNDYQCCVGCTTVITESLQALEEKKRRKIKTGQRNVKSKQILRQVTPLGEPVK